MEFQLASDASTDPGIALWLPLALIAIPAFVLWRRVTKIRDRGLAETLQSAAFCLVLMSYGALFLSLYGQLFPVLYWVGMGLGTALGLASLVSRYRDRQAARKQRAALSLAARRRLLSPVSLIVVWFISAMFVLFAYMIVASMIAVTLHPLAAPDRETTEYITIGGLAILGFMGIAGFIHVQAQPGRIAAEDDRLRHLDSQDTEINDDPDGE